MEVRLCLVLLNLGKIKNSNLFFWVWLFALNFCACLMFAYYCTKLDWGGGVGSNSKRQNAQPLP